MSTSIAHLGPPGTYAELAAKHYNRYLTQQTGEDATLCPYPTISQALKAVSQLQADLAVVPVENSIQGSVTSTLDTLWQLDNLQIQQALVLPIAHALLSHAKTLETIQRVYSHPQALAQCQKWLEKFLPQVQLIPANSTTEAIQFLHEDTTTAAIASQHASQLYNVPTLVYPINDWVENCTRFWVMSLQPYPGGDHTSLAFSLPANIPGALVKPLQIFSQREINLNRIESRPTKRSLGDYLFFIDLEANTNVTSTQIALEKLQDYTETLKIFGSYNILPAQSIGEYP